MAKSGGTLMRLYRLCTATSAGERRKVRNETKISRRRCVG